MQLLTPEESKVLWGVASEVVKWALSAIVLAIVASIRKTLRELPGKYLAPLSKRMDEHEAADLLFQEKTDQRFAARERFETATSQTLHRIESGMQTRRQAHGD